MRRSIWLHLVAAGVVVGGACGGGGDKSPPATGSDGGLPGRVISDADLVADAPVADGPQDAVAFRGDSAGDAAGLQIAIVITVPKAAGVVPAAQRFTPEADVTVDSPSFRAEDTLGEVSATLIELPARKRLGNVKMNQVSRQTRPESNAIVYRFADTPLDLTGAASGNYELQVVARTQGGAEAQATAAFQIDAGPTIRIDSPGENKPYKGSAAVDVAIYDDLFGPVSDVQMRVGQAPV